MARMPLLAAATAGGRRCLVDLWATAPSPRNWEEPLRQDGMAPSSSWSLETKVTMLLVTTCVLLVLVCFSVYHLFCRNKEDEEQHTSWFVHHGPWSNNDDGEGVVSAPPPPPPLQEQQPPEREDGHAPWNNNYEGDRPRRQRRRRRPAPAVAEAPAADVEMMALGEVHLTEAGVEWMLANSELLQAAADVDTAAAAADEEIAPAPELAPTLKCTFSTAEGWAEGGTCSVCLSELVDGEKVRVVTTCMHCFHATCVDRWLHKKATCPLCRTPTMPVGRRIQRPPAPAEPNSSLG